MVIVRYQVNGSTFEVDDTCYVLQHAIGQGAYGTVCSAIDVRNGDKVAIKKVAKAFQDVDTRRILREIKLLKHYYHENIIAIRDILKPRSINEFVDVYIVTDLMDTDLHQIIKSEQPLTDQHIQYFMYQVLRGLKCIHSANVLHRDLKPSNILLNANCDLKICDFGLARAETTTDKTDYVATRWYRAPELLMQWTKYDRAIDIWSVGCIFCELLGRKPLFPGKNYIDQLNKIIDIIGTPEVHEYDKLGTEQARNYIRHLQKKPRKSFRALYPNANALAIDLAEKMLVFNPAHRLTVEQCLAHPYFSAMHDEKDEPIAKSTFDYSFEKKAKTKADLKEMIYLEMLYYHPEASTEQGYKKGIFSQSEGDDMEMTYQNDIDDIADDDDEEEPVQVNNKPTTNNNNSRKMED